MIQFHDLTEDHSGAVVTAVWRSVFVLFLAMQAASAQIDRAKIIILQGAELLHQCSRETPPSADGTWNPTLSDVQKLEALLPSMLVERGSRLDAERVLDQSARQYAGFIRNGRRYLYGSFFPADLTRAAPEWRTKAIAVCDGGPSVFGLEMDFENGTISHLSFNGHA